MVAKLEPVAVFIPVRHFLDAIMINVTLLNANSSQFFFHLRPYVHSEGVVIFNLSLAPWS